MRDSWRCYVWVGFRRIGTGGYDAQKKIGDIFTCNTSTITFNQAFSWIGKISRNMLVVQKKVFVLLTRKFRKVSVIHLDAIKNASRKKRTPKSLDSMVWTPSRMLAPQSRCYS